MFFLTRAKVLAGETTVSLHCYCAVQLGHSLWFLQCKDPSQESKSDHCRFPSNWDASRRQRCFFHQQWSQSIPGWQWCTIEKKEISENCLFHLKIWGCFHEAAQSDMDERPRKAHIWVDWCTEISDKLKQTSICRTVEHWVNRPQINCSGKNWGQKS